MLLMHDLKRFSLFPVVRRFIGLINREFSSGKASLSKGVFYLLPVLAGLLSGLFFDASHGERIVLIPIMSVAGTLVAAYLAGTVLMFNLRIKIQDEGQDRNGLSLLISRIMTMLFYLVIPSAVIMGFSLLSSIFWEQLSAIAPITLEILIGTLVFLGAHIIIVSVIAFRNFYGLYNQMFKAELTEQLPEKLRG